MLENYKNYDVNPDRKGLKVGVPYSIRLIPYILPLRFILENFQMCKIRGPKNFGH